MNLKPMKLPRASAFLMTLLVACGLCQGALASTVAAKVPVQVEVDLPFAPAVAERVVLPAPSPAATEIKDIAPVVGATVIPKFVPVVKVEAPVPAAIPATTVNLQPGKTVASQLTAMGLAAGWYLVWDAPDFTIEQVVPVSSDFILAVSALIESASSNGTNLKATFYRGNNTVRVTEF